jgi:hypothetical protein
MIRQNDSITQLVHSLDKGLDVASEQVCLVRTVVGILSAENPEPQ